MLIRNALTFGRRVISAVTSVGSLTSRRTVTLGFRTMSDCPVIKSLNDNRDYRLISLDNGLRALLISDLDGSDQSEFMEEETASQSDSEEDADCSESASGSDSDEGDEMMVMEEDLKQTTGEKKSAAALCVGVGGFSDPDDIPGFAHFLEHMVFMGSEKYPDENSFDDYISRHGGESNAWTDHERTCFYFDVERNHFQKSLDKFAQFFVAPLLRQDSVDREIEAVDSEFHERTTSDVDRVIQLMASTAKTGNPIGKFLLGNSETLKVIPAHRGEKIYGRLRDFYNQMYSAPYMTLAVHSKHTLDVLEHWVRESFSSVPNNEMEKPVFSHYAEPFNTKEFTKFYKVVPVENVHRLIITWAFPPLQQHYRMKPLDYLSTLLTYDGHGGIFSYLNKRTWALEVTGGNSGDGFDENSTWSGFDVSIALTDDGLKHINDVIVAVFEYIHMLQETGPSKGFYEEMKMIEEAKFRWKEQGDPTEYLERVCENMQRYPPEDFLTGHKFWYQYDEKLLEQCTCHLRPDNCNIIVVSNTFAEQNICNQTERWFGTKYSVSDIDCGLMARLKDVKRNEEFFMPGANKFIATDFTLKEIKEEDASFVPRLAMQSSRGKVFYKKDSKFNVPKGFVNMHLKSPVVCDSLKSATLFELFVTILMHNVTEDLYPANLAGYELTVFIDDTQTGAVVQVDGFNHKLAEVLDAVFDHICEFTCDEALFSAIRTQLKKNYYNGIIKPYEAARMVRYTVIQKYYWSQIDKLRIVDSLTREELQQMVKNFLSQVFVESLVVGNFTQEEAVKMCDNVMNRLTGSTGPTEKLAQNHVFELPQQSTYCQVKGFNPTDVNGCVLNYYQSVPGSLKTSCLNQLLTTRLREPCFNTLRTKQQLGYSVFSLNYQTFGVLGLGIVVECQSSKHSMAYVDSQIGSFLEEMKDILDTMKQEEFEGLVESVITLKKTEDTHLGEEVSRYWTEIQEETYLFDRRQREINILQTLTLQELREWFSKYYGPQQRKLSVQLIGCKSSTDDTSKVPGSTDTTIGEVKFLEDPDQTSSVVVTDIGAFKQTLKSLPFIRIIS